MTDFSFIHLFWKASLIVKLIILILIMFSIVSWALILYKQNQLQKVKKTALIFEEKFWSANKLSALFQQITQQKKACDGLEQIFIAGFKEFMRFRSSASHDIEKVAPYVARAMRLEMNRDINILEANLVNLSVIGSISPYIGLFGTVWGIMQSFIALGSAKQATLQMVAPGIAEALIATAIGLFAAIPAVIAYNKFNNIIEIIYQHYDNFIEEFIAILYRQTAIQKNEQ